jgi:signal transduction histidine kinase
MKSAMVSTVSHELKTPLTSIRMATHLLLEGHSGTLTPEQTELVTAAREDSDRLYSIIDDLLDMGRIESGRAQMDLEKRSVPDLVDSAARAHQSLFRDKGVRLELETPDGLPPVLADANRLRHVFANLLDNALRHTAPGGRVVVAATARGAAVEITVSDSGDGITREHLSRIFDRFYRADDDQQPRGAGLGLAIVKEIVEAHDGEVSVESKEGLGSVFRFTLRAATS